MENNIKEELLTKAKNRSDRLIKLLELGAPKEIIKNELKLLNDICDEYLKKNQ